MSSPRYPIEVELVGHDGNAMSILATVGEAINRHLRDTGTTGSMERDRIVAAFTTEATSGDYDHLLQTCMAWVDIT